MPLRARICLSAVVAAIALAWPARADPEAPAPEAPPPEAPEPWCAPELETLPGNVCHFAHPAERGTDTLVIFLHGLVKRGAGWQHAQQRGIVRGARRAGFSVLAPRGWPGVNRSWADDLVAWPSSPGAQVTQEAPLLEHITQARQLLETRRGRPFDEVFVVGFSNGAYYATSLALRDRLPVDGYAVFAGGGAYSPAAVPAPERAPIFVGICNKDDTTKKDARGLQKLLAKVKWPHQAEARNVGHAIADRHLDNALSYLRAQAKARRAGEARLNHRAR